MAQEEQAARGWDRIIELLGGTPAGKVEQLAAAAGKRAYEAGFSDGNDEPGNTALRSFGYRRSSGGGDRTVDHTEHQKTAWELWQSSPVAKRALTLKRDHIIGGSLTATAADPTLAELIEEVDRANRLGDRWSQWAMELFLWGELCLTVRRRASDGLIKLRISVTPRDR